MSIFLHNLVFCSFIMSVISIAYIIFGRTVGSRYSAKQRYYAFLVLLIGFLTPFKPKLVSPSVVVNVAVSDDFVKTGSDIYLWESYLFEILFLVWFLGFALCISYQILRHARFMSCVNRFSKAVDDDNILRISGEVLSQRKVKGTVKLREFKLISSPMIVGLFEPTLLLPHTDFTDDELKMIFNHEYVHLKRKDTIYKVIIQLFKAVHWFNPLVHFIANVIERECEISCDEEVVKNCTNEEKQLYCSVILDIVNNSVSLKTAFSTNFSSGKVFLKRRFGEILSTKIRHKFIIVGALVLLLTVLSGTVIAFAVDSGAVDTLYETTTQIISETAGVYDTAPDFENEVSFSMTAIYSEFAEEEVISDAVSDPVTSTSANAFSQRMPSEYGGDLPDGEILTDAFGKTIDF